MQTPEGKEKTKVKAFLTEIGACHRWPVPYGYGQPDIDCHACIGGQFWVIEGKRPGAEPTPIQWSTLRQFEESGARVAWGTADDIIPVIERWMRYRAFGGHVAQTDTDPHATGQQGRQISGGRGG